MIRIVRNRSGELFVASPQGIVKCSTEKEQHEHIEKLVTEYTREFAKEVWSKTPEIADPVVNYEIGTTGMLGIASYNPPTVTLWTDRIEANNDQWWRVLAHECLHVYEYGISEDLLKNMQYNWTGTSYEETLMVFRDTPCEYRAEWWGFTLFGQDFEYSDCPEFDDINAMLIKAYNTIDDSIRGY